MKTKVVILFCVLVTASALFITFRTIKNREKPITSVASATTQGGNISLDPTTQQSTPDNTNQLQVDDGTSSSQNNGLPTPDQFNVYETHKDDKGAGYIEVQKGTGAVAEAGKKVAVNYKGWLTDGTLFDQSKEGAPISFTLGNQEVIPGWESTIAGMLVGGKRRLIIPPAMGYGDTAQGPIPAGSMLIFDVELVSVQ